MTSGAVLLSMPRAQVTCDGVVLANSATVTVQGGQATAMDRGASITLRMAAASVERTGRRTATVVGLDGTTWHLQRRAGG